MLLSEMRKILRTRIPCRCDGRHGDFDLVSPERNSKVHDKEGVVVATGSSRIKDDRGVGSAGMLRCAQHGSDRGASFLAFSKAGAGFDVGLEALGDEDGARLRRRAEPFCHRFRAWRYSR